jgi:hypothetical protein
MSLYDGWDAPKPGWVCGKCGFAYDSLDPVATPALIDDLANEYRTRLLHDAANDLDSWRLRPDRSTWSALEYACHVRDCFALYDFRIRKVLREDRPVLASMRRDEVVAERGYNQQDPVAVAGEVAANGASLSSLLESIAGGQWERVGIREGEEISVAWMACNTVHEGRHHLLDLSSALSAAGE